MTLAPQARAELCLRLAAAGLRRVEAGSFVRPGARPAEAGVDLDALIAVAAWLEEQLASPLRTEGGWGGG